MAQKVNPNRISLGFKPLNPWFPGSEYHHLRFDFNGNPDNDIGLHIPAKLHQKYYHDGVSGVGMERMNRIALEWYEANKDKQPQKQLNI